jgi:mycothiol synthase
VDLPDPFSLRNARAGDLAAVAELIAQVDRDETPDAQEAFLREEWKREGFSPERNGWIVADADGDVVAYAEALAEDEDSVDSWALVLPPVTGLGIGSALVDLIEAQAPRLAPAATRIWNTVRGGDGAAIRLLEARGYEPDRRWWHMSIELSAEGPIAVPAPAGVTIRAFDPEREARRFHEVVERSFAGHWGWHAEDFEGFRHREMTGPEYDPTLWFVAQEDGQMVGILVGRIWGPRGWVSLVGTLPEHRSRGIGRALLSRSFEEFRRRGLCRAMLNVDSQNETGATALYEKVGMGVVRRFVTYTKVLAPKAD